MSALLDTNACIALINGRAPLMRSRVNEFVARQGAIGVSTIVIFELRYGVAKSAQVKRNTRRLDQFLGAVDQIPFDAEDAEVAGRNPR